MNNKPIAAGKSSYGMIDADRFWRLMALEKNSILLDLGCGVGNYALAAASLIGPQGTIYALDAWREGIAVLKESAAMRRLPMIRPLVADITNPLPIDAAAVDVCLFATVIHDLIQDHRFGSVMPGVQRVLRPGGRLAVVEFKKIDAPPGPPAHIRLSPQELSSALSPFDFYLLRVDEVGDYHYLAQFRRGDEDV